MTRLRLTFCLRLDFLCFCSSYNTICTWDISLNFMPLYLCYVNVFFICIILFLLLECSSWFMIFCCFFKKCFIAFHLFCYCRFYILFSRILAWMVDLNQECNDFAVFLKNYCWNIWRVTENLLPLHSLSHQNWCASNEKVLWNDDTDEEQQRACWETGLSLKVQEIKK